MLATEQPALVTGGRAAMLGTQAVALQPSSTYKGEGQHALPPAASRRRYISPFALMSDDFQPLLQPVRLATSPPAASWGPRTPSQSESNLGQDSRSGSFGGPGSAPFLAGASHVFVGCSAPDAGPSLPPQHEPVSSRPTSSSKPILYPGSRRKWKPSVPQAPLSREQQSEECNAQSWPDEWVRCAAVAAALWRCSWLLCPVYSVPHQPILAEWVTNWP